MATINDPNGTAAEVDEYNRVKVYATCESEEHFQTHRGRGFVVSTALLADSIVPPVAGTYVLIIENTSEKFDLLVEQISFDADTSSVIMARVDALTLPSVPTNATAAAPFNSLLGNNTTFPGNAYLWSGGGVVAGPTLYKTRCSHLLGIGHMKDSYGGSLIVPKGFAVGVFAIGNAAAKMTCTARTYFIEGN